MGKSDPQRPLRIVNSVAPIRICDLGGWTDTWFAEHGRVFNIGVYPYAEVQIEAYPNDGQRPRLVIYAENFGARYTRRLHKPTWDQHPLLEAAIEKMGVPDDLAIQVSIYSDAPAGASTGTSAAVTVALLGALDWLTPGRLTPHEVAYAAQSVETDMLKQQCGIQDQLCSAYGGINYIDVFRYPYSSVSQLRIPDATWWELERRLVLVFLGQSHHSSKVHEKVIRHLEDVGPAAKQLEALRATAGPARDAAYAGDLAAFGRVMIQNTEAQRNLHPDLVSPTAQRVIEIARAHGAWGWKVNGAGGEGGSMTLLCGPLSQSRRAMLREIEQENPRCKNIPIYLSRFGLRVWETRP